MTENEKLRSLLAEAQARLRGSGYHRLLCDIDAALAEPVEGPLNAISRLQQQLHEAKSNADWLVQQAQRERDEARAEVERLRDALALSEVDVALARTWCRICRTENRSSERSRDAHPHETRCPLARRKESP